jgi:hypothetical protein
MSSPENFKDEYRIRVLAMLDEKSKGKEITIPAPAPQRGGKVVDIMEALKRSMERIPADSALTSIHCNHYIVDLSFVCQLQHGISLTIPPAKQKFTPTMR